jgi:hypothetical protein
VIAERGSSSGNPGHVLGFVLKANGELTAGSARGMEIAVTIGQPYGAV